MLIDKNARYRNKPVELEPAVFFGQLQHIFVVHLQASAKLKLKQPTTLILAAIRTCADITTKNDTMDIKYYSRDGHLEVVDISCIQCVVGRLKDGNDWAIIDRSGAAARPVFVDDNDDV